MRFEVDENLQAYGLAGHRHQPEIWQEWMQVRARGAEGKKNARVSGPGARNSLIFVPHYVPMNRGIFVNLYAPLARKMSAVALREMYLAYYLREPFINILGPGESPEVKAVTYTNACQIGVSVDPSGRQAIILAALDNLVKGASGQAIQNMNIMFGLDESTSLL